MKLCRFLVLSALFAIASVPAALTAEDGPFQMVILEGEDIEGKVFKRLGLPDGEYCWQQCLQDERCTGARWGVIAGDKAGQCQLMSGTLTSREPRELKTDDGLRIVVSAARKQGNASKPTH